MKTLHYVSINPRFRLHMEYSSKEYYRNSRAYQAELIKRYRKRNPELIEFLVFATEEDVS